MGSKLEDEKKDTEKAELSQNEDIVESSIGGLGPWHIRLCILIAFVKFPIAWHQLSYSFLAPEVQFTCIDNTTDKCSPNCTEHVFDRSVFTETIITQWDLVCGKSSLAALSQTVTMAGILVGNMLFGYLSDRFGRRNPLIWAVIIQGVTGILTAFSPWFSLFIVMRFLLACATGGTMVTSFVLIMESIGKKWRTNIGIIYQLPTILGHLSLPLISYFERDWQYFQLYLSIPSLLLFLILFWQLPESSRFLLTTRKTNEAIELFTKAATVNKLPTNDIKKNVETYIKKSNVANDKTNKKTNYFDLIRTRNMRKNTICVSLIWFLNGLGYYGVAFYMGALGGNIFLNVAVSALTQLPYAPFNICIMKYWGRKPTLLFVNIFAGLNILSITLIPDSLEWMPTMLGGVAMFCTMSSFSTIYIFSGELFPTVLRNRGIGTASLFARIGSMVAPQVVMLKAAEPWLPPVIFGLAPLLIACACLILPETSGCELPDTVKELEDFCCKKISNSNKATICSLHCSPNEESRDLGRDHTSKCDLHD